MNLKELFTDDDAVSPVIGVILMVAITVILAAVIGTFVLNLGDNLQQTSPTASFSFDEASDDETVIITHDGGDTIPQGNLKVTVNGTTAYTSTDDSAEAWGGGDDVNAGTSVTIESYDGGDEDDFTGDEIVRVVWTSDDGSNSQTLDTYTVQG